MPDIQRLGPVLLVLLIGISAIGPLALNGVLPATSAVMSELDTRYGMAQMVLTVYLFATLLAQFVLGPMADRRGRRPVMIGSLMVFSIGSIGCALAPSIEVLLIARFVQGFGGASCMFIPRTIVRDIYPRDRAASVIGYMTTAMMIAPMFGPAVGGWITDTASWRLMYVTLAIAGALLAIASWTSLQETLDHSDSDGDGDFKRLDNEQSASINSPSSLDNAALASEVKSLEPNTVSVRKAASPSRPPVATLLRERAFISYAMLMTGSVGVYYTFLAGAPWVAMESRGLDASTYGAWFAMVAVGYLSGNLVAGRFSERFGVARMIALGLIPFFLGVIAFWLLSSWSHPLGLFLPMQLVALSNGMSLPNMISGAMSVRPSLAASASGIAGGLQTAFGVMLTVAVGWLLPNGDFWLYLLATLCAVITFVGFMQRGRGP